jgi:hypothetical protein
VTAHIVYLLGGARRVGKSVLAQRLLALDGIPWLPTDVIRTVVRRVVPAVDAADQDPVDAAALGEVMYPHIEQAPEVCAGEASRLLIEGFELAPSYPRRLRAALGGTEIRACFPGHGSFSAEDLAGYRGPKPQSESVLSPGELRESASWIRRRSRQLRRQCEVLRVPYVDVGEAGFETAMAAARRLLAGPGRCADGLGLWCLFVPNYGAVLALVAVLARWLDDLQPGAGQSLPGACAGGSGGAGGGG